MMRRAMAVALAGSMLLAGTPALAQLLGGNGTLRGLLGASGPVGTVVGEIDAPLDGIGTTLRMASTEDMPSLRRDRLRLLLRANRAALDADDAGNPVRRDEIVAIDLSPEALKHAQATGFVLARQEAIEGLGLSVTILTPPKNLRTRKAIEILRKADPQIRYTLDHVYEPAAAGLAPAPGPAATGGSAAGATIGLIDGGVGNHPAFAGATIEQRGFAGPPRPSGHGTAVASLMVGQAGAFHGVAPGTALLVADVYGGAAANGSAEAIVRAMGWLAVKGARVINISLVGPPNSLLEAGVAALTRKNILVVAAVGNDGPAAPPQFPASYPGVVAVTGVDGRGKPLIEAGKPLHLDFAAPGADMAGAISGGGWEVVRGTSFAAPLVSARLAQLDHGNAARTLAALVAEAKPAVGKTGRGIVCGNCATPPSALGLK